MSAYLSANGPVDEADCQRPLRGPIGLDLKNTTGFYNRVPFKGVSSFVGV